LLTSFPPQIKDAVRAAYTLADFEKLGFAIDHLHMVLDGKIFENDFKAASHLDFSSPSQLSNAPAVCHVRHEPISALPLFHKTVVLHVVILEFPPPGQASPPISCYPSVSAPQLSVTGVLPRNLLHSDNDLNLAHLGHADALRHVHRQDEASPLPHLQVRLYLVNTLLLGSASLSFSNVSAEISNYLHAWHP
jgi:hypothetical protein